MFHQHISDAVRTTLWQASALWTARTKKEDKTREEADMTPSPFFPKSSKVVQKCPRVVQIHISSVFLPLPIFWITFGPLLDTFGKKQAKGHVSLLPGLVLLVALAVHSALACHSVVRTASDRY